MIRRYAPLAAIVLAQLAVIALAPSKAPLQQNLGFSPDVPGPAATDGVNGPVGGTGGPAVGGTGGTTTGGTTTAPGTTGGGPTARGPQAPGATGAPVRGDTSHCVRGRQFGHYPQAPLCVPKWTGTSNGGATSRGVTAKTIKLVYFREKDNPVVKGLLQSQGLYSDPEDQKRFMAAMEDFINAKYELYGRKVTIAFWSSPCQAAPPDPSCFRNDARRLVAQEQPFAVVYDQNTNSPEFFAELSKLKVINFGGWHFTDDFNARHRPYHYDFAMGGDAQAELSGEYWCKKLAGRKARYAGSADLRIRTRKVAVYYAKTEVNAPAAQRLSRIVRGCGTDVVDLPYAPDTATASQQATSHIARVKAEGVTSILYFSDPIAPAFLTKQATAQQYYPEHVLVGSGLLDYDKLARLYDPQQWGRAFGPGDLPVYPAFERQQCSVVWRATGRTGVPYASALLPWAYWTNVANGLQMAGPKLDPGTLERAYVSGVVDTPPYSVHRDPGSIWYHFGPGDYTAVSDAREAYWDPNAVSSIDGKQGAYRVLNNGRRYARGQWPAGESDFPIGR